MSLYGNNDNRRSGGISDYQANLESKLEQEVNQAFARGLIDEDTWREAVEQGVDGPSLVQRVMFDYIPMAAGATVNEQHTSSHGGFLETLGDVLSFSNYMTAAFTSEATDAAKAKGSAAAQLVPGGLGAALGAAAGTAVAPGVGTLVGAGIGAIGGTFLDPDFSYNGMWEAYRNKQDFLKYADGHQLYGPEGSWANVAGGFAMDVTLDPLTYLTFGVKPGARVALTKGMKIGAKTQNGAKKLLASDGVELSLTRFGKSIYDLAAQELMPKFRSQVKEGHLLDGPISAAWHNEIAEHAVTHFDDLAEKMLKGDAAKKAKILKMPREKMTEFINRATNPGYGVDDMFNETASVFSRERGFNMTAGQKILAGKHGMDVFGREVNLPQPVSGFFRGFFDKFDKGWDAAPEVVEQMKLAEFAVETRINDSIEKYQAVFGHMPKDQRETVSKLIEKRFGAADSAFYTPGDAARYSDDIENAVDFVRAEMDDILKFERDNGFATQNVDAYISHVYAMDPKKKVFYNRVMKRNGVENPSAHNRFTQQRMIATIAEGRDVYGEEGLLLDAYEILAYRKRMSVEMVEKANLFKWIAEKQGIPTLLIHAQKDRLAGGVIRGMMRRYSQGHAEVLDIDQMWTAEMGNLKRLGFKRGDTKHNVDLMQYLMRPNTAEAGGKMSEEGLAHGQRLGVNERAKWWGFDTKMKKASVQGTEVPILGSKALSETFSWSPIRGVSAILPRRSGSPDRFVKFKEIAKQSRKSQKGINYPVTEAFAMLDDPTHVGWKQVFSASEFGFAGEVDRAAGFLSNLDRYLRKNLDANVVGFYDGKLSDSVREAFEHHFPGKEIDDEVLDALDSALGSNVEVRKLVPQIPPSLVEMAKATREAVGIDTHRLAALPDQLKEIRASGIRLGFDFDTFQQLTLATFGKKGIDTVHEADIILDMFRTMDPDDPGSYVNSILKGTGETSARFRGDPAVKRSFVFPRRETGNVLPEIFDQDLGIPTAGLPSKTPAGKAIKKQGPGAPESADVFDVGEMASTGVTQKNKQRLAVERARNKVSKAQIEHQQALRALRHSPEAKDMLTLQTRMSAMRKFLREIRKDKSDVEALVNHAKAFGLPEIEPTLRTGMADKALEKLVKKTLRDTRKTWNKKDYKKKFPEWKADQTKVDATMKVVSAAEDLLRKAEDALSEGADRVFQGGGIKNADVVDAAQASARTSSDELLALRKAVGNLMQRAEDGEDIAEQLAAARERLAKASQSQIEFQRTGIPQKTPDQFTGGIRPNTGSDTIELAIPESVAKLVDQFMAPDIDPKVQGWARDMLRKYDNLQGFYKANLLLPWGGYWLRNVMSNAVLGYMANGLRMFAPGEGQFRDAWWNTLVYTMHKHSDMTKHFGYEGIDDVFEKLGEQVVRAKNGREMKIKDISKQMHIRGVFKGMISGDVMDNLTMGQRVEGAITGGAAGAAVGTAAGAGADVINEQLGGADSEASSVGGVLGLAAGAALGGRSAGRSWGEVWDKVLAEKLGTDIRAGKWGLPTPGIDKATGLIQSRWKPFLRAGEHASETPFRMAVYIGEFLDSGSNYSAMNKTNEALNDWGGLSVFERRIMRRIMPFYAWTKFAVEHSFRSVVETPGRHVNLLKAFRDWNHNHEADPEDVPSFLHEKLVMVADSDSPLIGMMIGDDHSRAITGFGAPIEDVAALSKALNPFGSGDQAKEFRTGILSRTAFGAGSVIEGMFNEDLFTGREIVSSGEVSAFQKGEKWADAPAYLKHIVGYRPATADSKEIVDPKIAWILGEVPVSRFIALARDIHEMDESDRKRINVYTMSKSFLGASVYKVNPQTNQFFVNKGRIEALVSVLSRVGAIKKMEWYSDINRDDDQRRSSRIGGAGSLYGRDGKARRLQ